MPRKQKESRRILTSLTYNSKHYKGEINNKPSQTIPDESISVKEMLYRYSNGIPMPRLGEPVYIEDERDIPINMRQNFDLTDLDDAREELEQIKENARNRAKRQREIEAEEKNEQSGMFEEAEILNESEKPVSGGTESVKDSN